MNKTTTPVVFAMCCLLYLLPHLSQGQCTNPTIQLPDASQPVVNPGVSYCVDFTIDPAATGHPTGFSMFLTHTFQGDLSIRVTACGNTLMLMFRPGVNHCGAGCPCGNASDLNGIFSFSDGGGPNPNNGLNLNGGNYGLGADPCGVGNVNSFAALAAGCNGQGPYTLTLCITDHALADVGTAANITPIFPTPPVCGCTDPSADNYNALANVDDGSCTYTPCGSDVQPPTALCQNVTVALVNGQANVTPGQINNNSVDNCGISSLALSATNFGCDDVGVNSVTLTVTDNSGNTSTCNATVTVTANVPVPTISGVLQFCSGDFTTLVASGGFQSYQWSTGEGSQSIIVQQGGTYEVTVTNSSGCPGTVSVFVNELPPPFPDISGTPALCAGEEVTLTADAGYSNYTWSSGSLSQSITVSQGGTYTVTVTDAFGCQGEVFFDVFEYDAPVPDIIGDQSICQGASASLSATAGYLSYEWSDGSNVPDIFVSGAGTYTVTVTDANYCTGAASITVTVAPPLTPTLFGGGTICQGEEAILSFTENYDDYLWSDGSNVPFIVVSAPGTYSVTVVDADGCEGTAQTTVTNHPAPTPSIVGDTDICEGESAVLSVQGGNFIGYQWSTAATTPSLSVNVAATYAVTVTDANGCDGVDFIDVNVSQAPEPVIFGNLSFCQNGTGILDVGVGYSTYAWSSGGTGPQITVSSPGTYSVTVTTADGCEGSDAAAVTVLPPPMPIITGSTTFCSGSSTTLTTTVPFASYAWSTGATTASIAASTPGTVSLTVTTADGCVGTTSVTLVEATELLPQISGALSFCEGGTTQLAASAGFASYLWSNGQTSSTITIDDADTYSVIVTDAGGCQGVATVQTSINSLPTPAITGENIFCPGTNGVSLGLNGVYQSYLWSNNATSASINAGQAGTYTVTVTDANGCQQTASLAVDVHPQTPLNIAGTLVFCTGDSTVLSASAGFASYAWASGQSSAQLTVMASGSYSLTAVDANGCTSAASVQVVANSLPVPAIVGTAAICQGQTATLATSSPYSGYSWSNASSSPTLVTGTAGAYAVTVTDGNGCQASTDFTLAVNPLPQPAISGSLVFCTGFATQLSATAGYASYSWSNNSTSPSVTLNTAGTYTLTVTDANGCVGTTSATIVEQAELSPMIAGLPAFCAGGSTVLDAGAGYATYLWSSGATGQSITVGSAGTVSVSVTDEYGCSGSVALTVTENALPTVNIGGELVFCAGDSTQLQAEAGYSAYLWSDSSSVSSIAVSQPGSYALTLTDANGCQNTAQVTVAENSNPIPVIVGNLQFCPEGSTTLSLADSYASVQWSHGPALASIDLDAMGDYTVSVTDANGCEGSSTVALSHFDTAVPAITGAFAFCPDTETDLAASAGYVSYAWSNQADTRETMVNTPGTYSVTATDSNACVTVAEVAVGNFAVAAPVILGTPAFCAGSSTALDASGDFVAYQWSTAATTQSITVSTAANIAVTATDANGCETSAAVQTTVFPLPVVQIGGSLSYCIGSATTLNAGSVYASYLWSDGSTGATLSASSPGTYGLIVTDANGCANSDSVVVIEDTELSPVISGPLAYCENASTTLDAGTGFATYQWSNSTSGQTLTVSSPGTYTVTVTDAAGCFGSAAVTVAENALPVPAILGTAGFCEGGSTVLSADASYAQYLWSNGSTSPMLDISAPGNYTLLVTDANGCQNNVAATVAEWPLPVFAISGTPYFCEAEQTTLSVPAGFSSYLWHTGSTDSILVADVAALYGVSVTNSFGCQAASTLQVSSIPLPVADAGDIGPLDCTQTTVSLGGAGTSVGGQFAYQWTGPGITPTNEGLLQPTVSQAGTYQLVVTDVVHGCVSLAAEATVVDLAYEPIVLLNAPHALTCTNNSVSITSGGSTAGQGIVYQWFNGNSALIPGATNAVHSATMPGSYTLHLSDLLTGCAAEASITVNEDREYPVANAGPPALLNCYEPAHALNGNASTTGTGISYQWSGTGIQQGGSTLTPLVGEPGVYTLTVTNTLNGCASTASVSVTQDMVPPLANAGADQELDCNNESVSLNGSQSSSAPGISYAWQLNGQPMAALSMAVPTVSAAGVYTLTVTNTVNGCTATDQVTVTLNPDTPVSIAYDQQNPVCFGQQNGAIIAGAVTGGTPPLLYSLNGAPFSTQRAFNNLGGGNYTLTVQDAIGCELSASITIPEGNDLRVNLGEDIFLRLSQSATLHALVNIDDSDIGAVTWQKTDTSFACIDSALCLRALVRPQQTTNYTVTVTDLNGCVRSDRITVFVSKPRDVYIPSGFSPNGDGTNDVFMIFAGRDVVKVRSFQTFNRWGEPVFEVYNFPPNDPVFGWDGTHRARPMNSDVFAWMAEIEFIDGEVILFKGDVTLVR